MAESIETDVTIIGGGPVGLTLAMDLAGRGIRVIGAGAARAGRAAERQMQPCRRPLDGVVPSPRCRAQTPGRRAAGGLPQRHRLPHDDGRAGVVPHPDPLPPRPLHRHRRPGYLVADPGAATPDQPDLSRTDPLRSRRDGARHHDPQSRLLRGPHAGRERRDGACARHLDSGETLVHLRALSDRVRRREIRGAPRDWCAAGGRSRRAARPVELHPRAAVVVARGWGARVGEHLAQPAPQRHCLRH